MVPLTIVYGTCSFCSDACPIPFSVSIKPLRDSFSSPQPWNQVKVTLCWQFFFVNSWWTDNKMADSKYFRHCRPNVVSVAYPYICMCVLPPFKNVKATMAIPR